MLPVRPLVRTDHIVEALQIDVEGWPAGLDDLAETGVNRNHPAVAAMAAKGFPIGGNNRPRLRKVSNGEGIRTQQIIGFCRETEDGAETPSDTLGLGRREE
ncbi:MAG: hypothetical protein PHO08_16615 [Methylococcales bacterium]|nr:hypothetical protein [Methylococcales bacterium]MDD5633336.1 hypothetical protein [Methylococcales bacterium]